MWQVPHVGIYQQKFFTTTPLRVTQNQLLLQYAIFIYNILLTKKQGQNPENRQYIDKSQNDCYPYYNENTYIKAKNGISTFC